jgi:type IV pilus assembly protein PilP
VRYAAIIIGVALVGLSSSFAREAIDEVVPAARPEIGHASLRPIEEEEPGSAVPALPPDLPAALPDQMQPDRPPRPGTAGSGVRDPFRPFTLDLQPKKVAEDAFLTPLQRYDLQQLTVVGVLLDLEPPRAMVQDDAGMGYIVTPGTLIGRQSGVVTDVQPRRVIVEETYVDFYGREQVRRAVLEMSDEEVLKKKTSRSGKSRRK